MENRLAVVDDPLFLEHQAEGAHPERPERLRAAQSAVSEASLKSTRLELMPRDASDEELALVHHPSYLKKLELVAGERGWFDPDTYYAPNSVAAARRAAGGALSLVDSLLGEQSRFGIALLRPPGHHARPKSAMGFCLINNVAVAAAHARKQGAERIAIVDWDVHHGNGTQEMFYSDPSVLYVSLHQFPFYPGTGAAHEVGEGEARGYTVNVPLSAGADDAVYAAAFDRLISPILTAYDPDLVLISAGFDAHRRDPLAAMTLSEAGYEAMTERIAAALPRGAAGRIGLLLEGGYDLMGLSGSLRRTLESLDHALAEATPGAPHASPSPVSGRIMPIHAMELDRAVDAQRAYWRLD